MPSSRCVGGAHASAIVIVSSGFITTSGDDDELDADDAIELREVEAIDDAVEENEAFEAVEAVEVVPTITNRDDVEFCAIE